MCPKCKQAEKDAKICLLKAFSVAGKETRPVKEFTLNGKKGFYEYDVVQTFASEGDARKYAKDHPDVTLLLD